MSQGGAHAVDEGSRMLALREAMVAASRADSVESMLQIICDAVTETLGFETAVARARRPDGLLATVAVSGPGSVEAYDFLTKSTLPASRVFDSDRVTERWGLFDFIHHDDLEALWTEPVYASDFEPSDDPTMWHPQDLLQAPLRDLDGSVVGLVQLDRPPGGRRPAPQLQSVLDMLTVQATLALRSVWARQRSEAHIDIAELGRELLSRSAQGDAMDLLLNDAAAMLSRALRATAASINLHADADLGTRLTSWASRPDADARGLDDQTVAVLWQLAFLADSRGDAVGIHRPKPDPALSEHLDPGPVIEAMSRRGLDSLMVCPIRVGEQLIGALTLVRGGDLPPFSLTEGHGALAGADDLGKAIRNALLLARERRVVEQLRRAELERTELFATISHEFRGPITAIAGHLELLEDESWSDASASLRAVRRNLARMNEMLDDMLGLHSSQSRHPRTDRRVDVVPVLREAVDLWGVQARLKSLELICNLPGDAVLVRGDDRELGTVFSNLISNAVKYTPDHGRVLLRLRVRDGRAVLTCTDTGIGIGQDDQPHVFEQFYRGASPDVHAVSGTGLGLSIVARIVERHDGTLTLHSALGEGSTFTLTLPVAETAEP